MEEWFKWAMGLVGSLFGVLYLKNERELARLSKHMQENAVATDLFQAHVRECERIHAEARESRREILAWLERLDEKIDELRGRP